MENNPTPHIKNEKIEVTIEVPKKKRVMQPHVLENLKKGREGRIQKYQESHPGYISKKENILKLTDKINELEAKLKANEPKPKKVKQQQLVVEKHESPIVVMDRKIDAHEAELEKPDPVEVEKKVSPLPPPVLSRTDHLYQLAFGNKNKYSMGR